MTLATQPHPNVAVPPPILMRRWTVEEYHTLIKAGVFAKDERFELLEGWIVPKMSRNPPHDTATDLTQEELRPKLPAGWRMRIQAAITTIDSEPEPDIAVVRGSARDYSAKHPTSENIGLIIEIAESSLREDRRDKTRIYARAGIAIYWIVNLADSQVEVYTNPSGPTSDPVYSVREDYAAHESVPVVIAGQFLGDIPVRNLLP